jgi:membrane-bound lytic murein transglycosylase D
MSVSLAVEADEGTPIPDVMLINSYNTRQDADIWTRMRRGFQLSHEETKLVLYYERLYTKSPKTFARLVANAKPYIFYILTQTERNGMPSEIALLPGVESTFNPNAKSSSNAYGMWQFVASTGTRFNMAQNSSIDERQDLVKSTNSALSYLNYLHKLFGQWEPAIGAYNWGEGNMYKEIIHSGQKPGNIDYASLNLRSETENYVPKLIALASIIDNPSKFGVNLEDIENKPVVAVVNPPKPMTISQMINLAGIDKDTFNKLNPQYKSTDYTVGNKDHVVLPLSNEGIYLASVGRNQFQTPINENSIVLSVENQNDESAADGVDLIALAASGDLNNQESNSNTESAEVKKTNNELDNLITELNAPPPETLTINYIVANGDTLFSIAKRFGEDINEIKTQNNIVGNSLTVGETLTIKTSQTGS